ncbi:hypothetical protein ACJ41O_006321 [Fusarium nematophilum]
MRIGTIVSIYSLISFLSVCFPAAEVYIHPWLSLVEGLSLGSFFLLLCDYVSPHHDQREVFFATKKTRWFMIFQMPVIALVVSIATDITAAIGIYCEWGNGLHFAKFWLRLIQSISLVASVLSILQFYKFLKTDLAHHRPLVKLIALKAIVFLTFLQSTLFWILTDAGALKETDTLTFADLHIGIPNLLACVEMVPLSLFFVWAYPWTVYLDRDDLGNFESLNRPGKPSKPYQGGPFGIYAWLAMINPSDTIKAILFAFGQVGQSREARSVSPGADNEPLYPDGYRLSARGPRADY